MIAYFNCYSGVAGDMILGAMLDAGLPFSHLKRELKKLPLRGYKLVRKVERRGGIGGVKLSVARRSRLRQGFGGQASLVARHPLPFPSPSRGRVGVGGRTTNDERRTTAYKSILRPISKSRLGKKVKDTSLAIFHTLAAAEAKVHRCKIEDVHFHEVGAIDSIVDIVGAAIGFDWFGFDEVYASPLPITRGFVRCAHGKMPVPAPATLEIIKGIPLERAPVKGEIVTPTGAAILKTVVKKFGECPLRKIERVGYGHGDKIFKDIPNALTLMIGEGSPLLAIEVNIDDMNPQFYDYVIDEVMSNGAIDAIVRPVWMKKRRPGAQIQVLCEDVYRDKIIKVILRETTSLGVRFYPVERKVLHREIKTIKTKYGPIRLKLAINPPLPSGLPAGQAGEMAACPPEPRRRRGVRGGISPEYEDVKRAARLHDVPIKVVYDEVTAKGKNLNLS